MPLKQIRQMLEWLNRVSQGRLAVRKIELHLITFDVPKSPPTPQGWEKARSQFFGLSLKSCGPQKQSASQQPVVIWETREENESELVEIIGAFKIPSEKKTKSPESDHFCSVLLWNSSCDDSRWSIAKPGYPQAPNMQPRWTRRSRGEKENQIKCILTSVPIWHN